MATDAITLLLHLGTMPNILLVTNLQFTLFHLYKTFVANNKIQLNVCPTSNIMLKVVDSYANHPIRKLYDYSVPVTINTDDLLIFNQSISQEYLNLYNSKLMTADELDGIRERGLIIY